MSRESRPPEGTPCGVAAPTPSATFREGFLVLLSGEPENQAILRRFGELLHTMVGETVRAQCPVPVVYAEAEAARLDLVEVTERLREAASYADVGDPDQVQVGAVTGRQAKALRKVTAALEAALRAAGTEDEGPEGEEAPAARGARRPIRPDLLR